MIVYVIDHVSDIIFRDIRRLGKNNVDRNSKKDKDKQAEDFFHGLVGKA